MLLHVLRILLWGKEVTFVKHAFIGAWDGPTQTSQHLSDIGFTSITRALRFNAIRKQVVQRLSISEDEGFFVSGCPSFQNTA